jgi:hypothetical protein
MLYKDLSADLKDLASKELYRHRKSIEDVTKLNGTSPNCIKSEEFGLPPLGLEKWTWRGMQGARWPRAFQEYF